MNVYVCQKTVYSLIALPSILTKAKPHKYLLKVISSYLPSTTHFTYRKPEAQSQPLWLQSHIALMVIPASSARLFQG